MPFSLHHCISHRGKRGQGKAVLAGLALRPLPRFPTPAEQLLRRQTARARNRRHPLAVRVALGNDLRLLTRSPHPTPSRSGKHFTRRTGSSFDLGKNSVSDTCPTPVSKPARFSARTIAHRQPARNVGLKGRLQCSSDCSEELHWLSFCSIDCKSVVGS
jgi:hypothetical protein